MAEKLRSIYALNTRKHMLERMGITTKNKLEMSRSFCSCGQSFLGDQSFLQCGNQSCVQD